MGKVVMMTGAIFWEETALMDGQVGLHGGSSPTAAPCHWGKEENLPGLSGCKTFSSVSLSENGADTS